MDSHWWTTTVIFVLSIPNQFDLQLSSPFSRSFSLSRSLHLATATIFLPHALPIQTHNISDNTCPCTSLRDIPHLLFGMSYPTDLLSKVHCSTHSSTIPIQFVLFNSSLDIFRIQRWIISYNSSLYLKHGRIDSISSFRQKHRPPQIHPPILDHEPSTPSRGMKSPK